MGIETFLNENYLTFLILGGLLTVIAAFRDKKLPAAGFFVQIAAVLFVMALSSSVERWAVLSPDREALRVASSVVHYILQPVVIWFELILIMPQGGAAKGLRHRRLLLSLPLMINALIYAAAPFAGHLVFWYDEAYRFHRGPLGSSIYVVTFFYLGLLLLWSVRLLMNNDKRQSMILFFVVFSALLTGILEGFNLITGAIDEVFALGVFLYYIYLLTIHEAQLQSSLAAKELELSHNKIRLLREQMQPHFIFNSLQVIRSLIRKEPEKAILCLEDFSDYLRANLDAIASDRLVPFTTELDHVKAYASLALADDSKGISICYDIEESGFMLPPLSIEPLVENALRYGASGGGTVTLAARSDRDSFIISISDPGRSGWAVAPADMPQKPELQGFSPYPGLSETHAGTRQELSRLGVGLRNVESRLAAMCGGHLEIHSGDDGTVVTVRIPKGYAPKDSAEESKIYLEKETDRDSR